MSYDYKETPTEIIIEKGIATREMWKEYDHGNEHVSFEELERACQIRPTVPIVVDTRHPHDQPLTDASKAVGAATLRPCPEKRGLSTVWRLYKRHLPEDLLEAIRRREPLPVSMYQFVNVGEDREQRDLLFDHIAILSEQEPRCPPERCGVGVYDSKMPKKEEIKDVKLAPLGPIEQQVEDELKAKEASTKAVQTEQKGTKEPPKPVDIPTPEPEPVEDKDSIIKELKEKLAKREEQIAEDRKPMVDELTQRGFQAKELNPLSNTTLRKMVQQSRAASTEGLPGTVPAPTSTEPLTLAESREKEQKRFETDLKKKQDEKWKDM